MTDYDFILEGHETTTKDKVTIGNLTACSLAVKVTELNDVIRITIFQIEEDC